MTEHLSDAALLARPTEEIGRLRSRSLLLPGIGLLAAAVGFAIGGDAFWPSYLLPMCSGSASRWDRSAC